MSESRGPASHAVQQAILMAIYAVFLGGVITAFTAVGLFTFYPTPDTAETQITQLDQREAAIYSDCKDAACELTAAQRTEIRAIELQREELWQAQESEQQAWNRTSGLIMIGIATLLLALSLIRWDRAIVISNGLLLGGLFTMVFGIGLTLAGGEGVSRFIVLTIALVITVVLGYLRFARRPATPGTAAEVAPTATPIGGVESELAIRMDVVEDRLRRIGEVLGGQTPAGRQ
ncbi:MAG: hypothetical protein KDC23_13160 [Actinobacteria bacterium]|nr:hypothetical protein [Actinomycetota bacterium]